MEMKNLPERLRDFAYKPQEWTETEEMCREAADEIERLQAIVDKLPRLEDVALAIKLLLEGRLLDGTTEIIDWWERPEGENGN